MQKRYPALHIISLLFKILAVVVIVIGIVLMFVVFSQGANYLSFTFLPKIFGTSLLTIGAVPILLFSLAAALILWGIAELLICLIDIENNTRMRAVQESQRKETPPAPVAVTLPAATPIVPPPPLTVSPEEAEKKTAATLSQRKQNIKDILNKKLW